MLKKSLFCSLILTSLLATGLFADGAKPVEQEPCGESPRPMRVTMRHIEGKGVGYNQGYSTLEGFFSPVNPWNERWIPFLDLRGHAFNNGKAAANAGIGARYITTSRVWGANTYYDYRNTNHEHYNQVSLGFESLGKVWDFRINGYLPVGNKTSSYYQPRFAKFQGHSLYISRKREFAMKGVNAEVGAHVDTYKKAPLYFAAGPYYLEGQGKIAWGGEIRAAVDIYDYVRIEGNTSYDNVFKWIGQGQISINIPFGAKRKIKNSPSCKRAVSLSQRALQRVDRNEIIPTYHQRRTIRVNLPYSFIFVNNTSHSNGTWESPYTTLQQAQAASSPDDVIYVFPGDGSPYDVAPAGFVMQNGQNLWGSATAHQVSTPYGTVTIPALSTTRPSVTNSSSASTIITMANNSEVSGMHLVGADVNNGISATSVNVSIRNNLFEFSSASGDVFGISATNSGPGSMTLIASNNQFSNLTPQVLASSFGIYADNNGSGSMTATISNNLFSPIASLISESRYGAFISNDGSGTMTATLSSNQFSRLSSQLGSNCFGAVAESNGSGSMNVMLVNNQFYDLTTSAGYIVGIDAENNGTGSLDTTISNNQFSGITGTGGFAYGINLNNMSLGSMTTSISDNQLSGITSSAFGTSFSIFLENSAAGRVVATITGNQAVNSLDVARGIDVQNNLSGNLCLKLNSNNMSPSIIALKNLDGGVFTLDPSSTSNVPTPVITGTITSGSCSP